MRGAKKGVTGALRLTMRPGLVWAVLSIQLSVVMDMFLSELLRTVTSGHR